MQKKTNNVRFFVKDDDGMAVAYVYFENGPLR
jgi:hypothetical protein